MDLSNQLKKISVELNDNQIKDITKIIKQKQDEGYMAGFFDGEGNVDIRNDKKFPNTKKDKIRINNTNKFILDCIQKNYGGQIYPNKTYETRGIVSRKPQWSWNLNGRYAVGLAKLLYLICIEKKEKLGKFIERNKKNAERI